jgi:hypothetical protein
MRQKPLKYFILSVIFIGLLGYYEDKLPAPVGDILSGHNGEVSEHTIDQAVILSDKRKQHILYGNGKSGGHKHGVGTPCKSEFPADWDDDKIINVTKRIAANDNLAWKQQDNGYHVSEYLEDDIRVRVVLGPRRERIITSYPTNVTRNPCPANDN